MLNLEQQVCSLEDDKRLKNLVVKQESLFYWVLNENNEYNHCYKSFIPPRKKNVKYSALTVVELFEMLYEKIYEDDLTLKKLPDEYEIEYYDISMERRLHIEWDKNITNCLTKMLIHLLENKLITIDEINKEK